MKVDEHNHQHAWLPMPKDLLPQRFAWLEAAEAVYACLCGAITVERPIEGRVNEHHVYYGLRVR